MRRKRKKSIGKIIGMLLIAVMLFTAEVTPVYALEKLLNEKTTYKRTGRKYLQIMQPIRV